MGCVIGLLLVLGRFVLGLAVFAGLLHLLVISNFTLRSVNSDTYYLAISDTNAYNRIYSEVLVDEVLSGQIGDLLAGLEVDTQERKVELLRQIMPPDYLQEQTENNVDRFTGYLNGQSSRFELYVELGIPLERIEPTVQGEVDRFIDELEIIEPEESGCSASAFQWLAENSAQPLDDISGGRFPASAPSLQALTRECREREFDRWFDTLSTDPSLSSQTSLLLRESREDLRASFVHGDTRAFLKEASQPLVSPRIDAAIGDIRRELKPGDRLDLIEKMVESSRDLTRDELDAQAEELRDALAFSNGNGRVIALVLIVGGGLLMALMYLPDPGQVLRWPGLTLVLGGGICLIVGFVLNSAIPGQFKDALVRGASYSPNVPSSAVNLAGDLLESFGRQATDGFLAPAIIVLALGVALVASSFVAEGLVAGVRRALPKSRSRN